MARAPKKIHLAQFLVHGPTYHSHAMWRHPKTREAGYDWRRPELYEHIARTCERGKFDMVFFADLNYISDSFRGTLAPALKYGSQAPEHEMSLATRPRTASGTRGGLKKLIRRWTTSSTTTA